MDGTDGSRPETGGLTTGAVARRFGVAPTTLRSWDRRYGIGPAAHEDGKHRRWTAADLAVLERMRALTNEGLPPAEAARIARAKPRPAREPMNSYSGRTSGTASSSRSGGSTTRPSPRGHTGGGLHLRDARAECRGLARAALRLDSLAVDRLLEALITEHGLVTAWAEIIVPTLRAVGRKWQTSGEKYVEVEHLLSWHVSSALHRRQHVPAEVSAADLAVLACVPGETHTLPLEALAAALHERSLPVRMFGAALPAEALIEAVRRTGPGAVALWAQSRTTASRPLAQHVAQMTWGVRGARRRPAVLTLGPGWTAPVVPGTLRPFGLEEAVDAVAAVLTARPAGSPA
ncbi:MerR family transcriptional regulator [Streptomyces sp. NPDC055287]